MHMQMLENRMLRYVAYGVSLVVVSEVAYFSYRLVRKLVNMMVAASSSTEIVEVIVVNELTQTCTHSNYTPQLSSPADDSDGDGPISGRFRGVVPAPNAITAKCSNRYCVRNNIDRLVHWIDQAKYSIDLAMYTFTSHELMWAFSRAMRRGVLIRILSDREMVYSSGSQIGVLTKAGVPVRSPNSSMLMHHKFCILDGSQRVAAIAKRENQTFYNLTNLRSIIISGSLNWTMQGLSSNWENTIITSNTVAIKEFETEFERMWQAFAPKSMSSVRP